MSIHFIGAGAGSGKTHRLTELLHEKLSSGQARASGVIATTFTKKAAGELRERVRLALLEKRRFDLANKIGQARIGTVHSVCGNLLARFAFELGLSPDLRVVEEAQSLALVNQAIDAALDESSLKEMTQLEYRLGILDWGAGRDFRSELKRIIDEARSNHIDAEQLTAFGPENANALLREMGPPNKSDLDADLISAIEAVIPPMEARLAKKDQNNLRTYVTTARQMAEKLRDGQATWREWHALAKLDSAAAFRAEAEAVAQVARCCDRHPRLYKDLRRYLELMFSLAGKTLDIYRARKTELGLLDFTDQERFMLDALRHPDIAAVLRDELDILLVDEFQDTSPIQLALFLTLAGLAKETYWVGDIKQAIYGFRGSDTALMEAIVRQVPELGGSIEASLGESRRSRPALVHLVNSVFVPAFAGTLRPEEIRLNPLRPEILDTPAFAHWSLAGRKETDRAAALALGVDRLVGSGYQVVDKTTGEIRTLAYRDIAVLSRSNAGVRRIAAALREQSIPTAIAQPGLLKQPEAVLALACLRRLNDPGDTLASAEIVSLADSEAPESWLADRLRLTSAHQFAGEERDKALNAWREDNHPLLKTLAEMRQAQMALLAPHEALQLAIVRCGLATVVLRWQSDSVRGRSRLANLEALLGMASQYEESCLNEGQPATVSGLLMWLKDLEKDEEDGLAEPAVDAVHVMTHHKAKGLEWPVAILTDLEDDLRDRLWSINAETRGGQSDAADPLKDRHIHYWPWPYGKQTKDIELRDRIGASPIARRFRAAAIEEEKRLLYVSMTRARDLLVFAWPEKTATGEWFACLGADWLTLAENADMLILPDGNKVPCVRWSLTLPDALPQSVAGTQPLNWFGTVDLPLSRLPLAFNPSAAEEAACSVDETVSIGTRVALPGPVEMGVLGTAIHACLAAAFTDRSLTQTTENVAAILHRHGVADWVEATGIHRQVTSFLAWIDARWPNAEAIAEVPVESIRPNGQVLQGRIDLILKTRDGWILFDHKSNPGEPEQWGDLARQYSGQLLAYAHAVSSATQIPVIETWLFLPVAAGAARIVPS